jgi:precorrin-6A/cobalt-precorrin-6A reductase
MQDRPILILGGTREARELAAMLVEQGFGVITSLAGVTENPLLPPGMVRRGGFGGAAGLARYLEDQSFALVVDATHPFAARISAHAREACAAAGLPLLRLERPAWRAGEGDRWTSVASAAEAAAAVPPGARVLLTIGRKDLFPFLARPGLTGVLRMIEPTPEALPQGWTLLLERPPFTLAAERQLMADQAITCLVTKNAGGEATAAKLAAARELAIPVIMVERPTGPAVRAFDTAAETAAETRRLLSP